MWAQGRQSCLGTVVGSSRDHAEWVEVVQRVKKMMERKKSEVAETILQKAEPQVPLIVRRRVF